MKEKGFIQIYTGTGKGKTTAALGLAMRAVGAGFRIFIGQFLKQEKYSEHRAIKLMGSSVTLRTFGGDRFIRDNPSEGDIALAEKGLEELRQALVSEVYDLVIADEIIVAVHLGLLKEEDVLSLMRQKPENVELVLTGRYATEKMIAMADLVTKMVENKHYYDKGIQAREGIEK